MTHEQFQYTEKYLQDSLRRSQNINNFLFWLAGGILGLVILFLITN